MTPTASPSVVDTMEVWTTIEDFYMNGGPLLYIGGALLLLHLVIQTSKWVRSALT